MFNWKQHHYCTECVCVCVFLSPIDKNHVILCRTVSSTNNQQRAVKTAVIVNWKTTAVYSVWNGFVNLKTLYCSAQYRQFTEKQHSKLYCAQRRPFKKNPLLCAERYRELKNYYTVAKGFVNWKLALYCAQRYRQFTGEQHYSVHNGIVNLLENSIILCRKVCWLINWLL